MPKFTLHWSKTGSDSIELWVVQKNGYRCFEATVNPPTLPGICMDLVFDYDGLEPMEDTGPLSIAEHIEATLL
jgi:hypothetical protein